MRNLKLAVGKKYISRDGSEQKKIVRTANVTDGNYQKTHPFVDEDGYAYMVNGRSHPTREFPFDLVTEVVKPKPAKKTKRKKPKQSSVSSK